MTDSGELWIDGLLVNDLTYEEPMKIDYPEPVIQVACQDTGYLALGISGKLYFHGLDRSATVGLQSPADGVEPIFYENPVQIEKVPSTVKSFACSLGSVIARTEDDRFLTWGYNPSHGVSASDAEYVAEPSILDLPKAITSYSIGMTSGLAMADDGHIFGWGSVGNGLFPDAANTASYTPREIALD